MESVITPGVRAALFISFLSVSGVVHGYLTWIAVRLPLEGTVAAPGAPWPMPQSWTNNTQVKTLDPTTIEFTSNLSPTECDVIASGFDRLRKSITLRQTTPSRPDDLMEQLTTVKVVIEDQKCGENVYPAFGDNETYTLVVDGTDTAVLTANTVWGCVRGLETLSQLVYLTDDNHYRINHTEINDFPRYSYRGLMIDTARHYYTVQTIVKILETMSYDKFNVLHWHIVDDQSFPFESQTFPNLSIHGAYTPKHVYTSDDVKEVLKQARLLGIRVIPEFDTPGHTWSWGQAYPELITPCWGNRTDGGPYEPYVPNYPTNGPAEIINPMLNSTYEFMEKLFREISQVFPDDYIHLGMDEAYRACWSTNPNMTEWMKEENLTSLSEVEQYYANRLIGIVEKFENSRLIIWQDPIENNVTVKNTTLVEMWKDTSNGGPTFKNWTEYTKSVADKGYNMILSSPWYLNFISYGVDEWKKYYTVDPEDFTDDESQHELIKGGEACVWSEFIDPTNFLSLVWPRASAVAERLWSSKSVRDVDEAQFRLDQQRCRLVRRGIPAKPILNGYCGDYEWDMQKQPDPDTPVTDPPITSSSGRHLIQFTCMLFVLCVTFCWFKNF